MIRIEEQWSACRQLPEAFDPLSQCLRSSAERRVHRRFESAHRLVAGHHACGQGCSSRSARKPTTASVK